MTWGTRICIGGVLTALLLGGCSNDRRVALTLPISRMDLPEVSTGRIAGQVGSIQAVELELTDDQTQSPPNPATARFEDGTEGEALGTLDFRLGGNLSIGAINVAGIHGGRIKLNLTGPSPGEAAAGDASAAVTVAYGRGHDDFDVDSTGPQGGNSAFTRIDSRFGDAALILGYRTHRTVLVYGGGFHSRIRYRGQHENASNNLQTAFDGTVRARGLNLGLAFQPSRYFSVMLEGSRARLDADGDARHETAGSLGLGFSFWP